MNDQLILTDATIEAMLTRRAGPAAPEDLAAVIAADLRAMPEERRPWWSVLWPSADRGPAFRLAWIAAVTGLLLAATVSAMLVGSQVLRRSNELALIPAPTATPTPMPSPSPPTEPVDLTPLVLRPMGPPSESDTALGRVTWQAYEGGLSGLAATPHGPVAADDDGLRWLGDDGTWERLALPRGASPLISNGEALFTDVSGVVRRLSWDGGGWVVGEALDVPDVFRPADHPEGEPAEQHLERVATGPRGTILFGEGDFAIARDFQHFAVAARPPVGLDPVEPFVLATVDGFVAIVTTHQGVWDYGAFEPIPWFTADGTSWEPASASSPFGERAWIDGVAGWDGRFVAVGHVGPSQGPWTAWVSDDGLAWKRLSKLGDLKASLRQGGEWPFVGVTASAAGWVIYSKAGSAWASLDGRDWEPLTDWPAIRGMGWSPPTIVLAGDTIVGVRGGAGGIVIGTIERPGGEGG
jgi:hypothetical protein